MNSKFMFYENFLRAIEYLPEEDQGKACLALCRFGITGSLPDDPVLKMFCVGVSASVQKYQGRGGKRDGAGRKPQKSKEFLTVEDNQKNQNNQNNQKNQNEQTETININRNINRNINSKPKTETENRKKKKDLNLSFLEGSFLNETFKRFLSYRKEIKKPYRSQMSVEQAFNELQKLSGGSLETAEAIVNQSIANGWQGLFPLKTENRNKQPKSMAELYAEATNW